jgi:hypothetical protein
LSVRTAIGLPAHVRPIARAGTGVPALLADEIRQAHGGAVA